MKHQVRVINRINIVDPLDETLRQNMLQQLNKCRKIKSTEKLFSTKISQVARIAIKSQLE